MALLKLTIKLESPITHGDDVLHELTLTEPTLGGLMVMDDYTGNVGKMIGLISACSQLPPSVIKQLRARDLAALSEAADKIAGEILPGIGEQTAPGSPTTFTGPRAISNG